MRRKFYLQWNIRAKLVSSFLLIILVPIIVVTIYSIISTTSTTKMEIISRLKSNGTAASLMLSSELKKYELLCRDIVNDNSLKMPLIFGLNFQISEYADTIPSKYSGINEIAVYFKDGSTAYSTTNTYDDIAREALKKQKPITAIISNNGLRIISANFIMKSDNMTATTEVVGLVLITHNISIEKELFKDISSRLNTHVFLYENKNHAIMMRPEGNIINILDVSDKVNTLRDIEKYDSKIKNDTMNLNNEDYFVYFNTIRDLYGKPIGLLAVAENDKELRSKVFNIIFVNSIILIVFLVFTVIAAIYASNIFTRPIYKLIGLMKKLEDGDLLQRSDFTSSDEFGKMHGSFNKMAEELSASEDRSNRAQAIARIGNWEMEERSKNIWGTKEALRLLGLQGKSQRIEMGDLLSLIHDDDVEKVQNALQQLTLGKSIFNEEFRILRADTGEQKIIHALARFVKYDKNKPEKILGVFQDITEQKQAEIELKHNHEELATLYEELAASEEELKSQFNELQLQKSALEIGHEKYMILVDNISDLIYSYDLDFRFCAANKSLYNSIGLQIDEIIGRTHIELGFPPEYIKQWKNLHKKVIETHDVVKSEIMFKAFDDSPCYYDITLCPLFDTMRNISGVTVTCHNITELKKKESKIEFLAYYDSLTSIPNRVQFINEFNVTIEKAQLNDNKCAVVFVDIDNFKKINDTMGHSIGDELLKSVAKKLEMLLMNRGLASRFGGDEFLILLDNITSKNEVVEFANELMKIFERTWNLKNNEFHVTASVGIAIYPDDGSNLEDLLKNADTALYNAKALEKNNYQFFTSSMNDLMLIKVNIEKGLRKALKKGEFVLYYQVQLDTKSSKIRGVESLVRWITPELGVVSPAKFIPVAEETGLIIPIGDWVLETSCIQGKKWYDAGYGLITVCVNVSAKQLKQPDFVNKVKNILQETGFNPEYLELEITESVVIESVDATIKSLEELKALGIKIALDDFGTGYSSLNYLKQLPIDTLKMDKSFIEDINRETAERNIIDLIISIVHKMDKKVIAEGVENKQQLEYLANCGCDILQGYLLSKPLPENEVLELIKKKYIYTSEL